VQQWFQAEIFRPHEVARKTTASPVSAEAVVLPSKTLTAQERVAIYAGMYFARMHDVLAEDYPTLFAFLGQEEFERLARAYLARFPSRSYSLNFLGGHMPEFLSSTVKVRRRALLHDVASVEDALSQVFDAEESCVLTPSDLSRMDSEALAGARIETVRALRLLALDHPVNAMITAARCGDPLPEVRRRRSWTAVYRKSYQLWRMDLSQSQYVLLERLAAGATTAEAIQAAAAAWTGSPEELERGIFVWFREFVAEGLFSVLVLANGERLEPQDTAGSPEENEPSAPTTFTTIQAECRVRQISEAAAPRDP